MKKIFAIIGIIFAFPSIGETRWAMAGDLPSVVEFDRMNVTVESDGRAHFVRETLIRINNDQGRETESVRSIPFNSREQKIKIIDAHTVFDRNGTAKLEKVPPQNIEVKDVGEMSRVFDRMRTVVISYPHVVKGGKIYLKYEISDGEVPIPGFWSQYVSFPSDYIEEMKFHVRSKRALFNWKNDPKNVLRITAKKDKDGWFDTKIESTAPIDAAVVQEEKPYFPAGRILQFSLSTREDWSGHAANVIETQERELHLKLPAALDAIREIASKESTPLSKIQRVHAGIAQDFRYFGDWRRRNGGHIPRTLEDIALTRYGDCKDLSLVATAIFRALGFHADMVWVWRGDAPPLKESYTLPVDQVFNHAIVRVVTSDRTYWIDATNPVAFASETLPDIAGRPAFVLNSEHPVLDFIPELKSEGSLYMTDLHYELQKDQSMKVSGSVELKGRAAIGLTLQAFYAPVESINYDIIRNLANNEKTSAAMVGDFDRSSRVVKDMSVPVSFSLANTGLQTTAGLGFPMMREELIVRLMSDTNDRESSLPLDMQGQTVNRISLEGVKQIGNESLDCDLKSEWIDLSRRISPISKGVLSEDHFTVKAIAIPQSAFSLEKFKSFQDSVRRCFNRTAIILSRQSSSQ